MFTDERGKLGKYHLIAEIARGGMGIVYLAMNQGKAGFNKLVVVKELKQELVEDPGFLTMFLDEARLAARLNHPNIVQTHEIGSEGDRHFMAMEYLDGRTYERVRKRSKNSSNPLTLHMQLRVISDVLAGLHYAHELADYDGTPLAVVHRDVTPNNVFVTFDGSVKLLDFGIAKAADQIHETQAGVLKGKVAYMAPEQGKGMKVDARADVFSVGVMLWEAIAGRRLRSGNAHEIVKALTEDVPRLSKDHPDVPDQLDEIVAKATVNDRDRRYASAAAFQTDLEEYLAKLGGTPMPRDVGAVMVDLFKDDRAKTNQLIETYVTRARAGTAMDADLPVIELMSPAGFHTPTPGSPGNTHVDSFGTSSIVQTPGAQNVESAGKSIQKLPNAPTSKTRLALIAGGVVVVGAIAAYAFVIRPGSSNASNVSSTPPPPADSRPVDPPRVTPPTTPTVEVVIDAKPSTATITVDDAVVTGNPFRGKYRHDGVMHRIRVTAQGYEPQVRDIAFDRDVMLVLELDKPKAPPITNVTSAVVKRPVYTPAPPTPKTVVKKDPERPDPPKPVEQPKPVDPPKPAVKDPQINPNGGQKPIRTIDPKNPYGGNS